MSQFPRTLLCLLAAVGCAWAAIVEAGPARPVAPTSASRPAAAPPEMILLNFPPNMEVSILIDYVRKRLGMNLLYDEKIGRKRITIAASTKIPKDSLDGLFRSVLKISGLMIVDADLPGWQRIVPSADFLKLTKSIQEDPALLAIAPAATPVTHVFQLRVMTTASATKLITPLMSKPGGNIFLIPNRNVLVLSDYAVNLRQIRGILDLVDRPGPAATIQFIPLKHRGAAELARQVTDLLKRKADVSGATEKGAKPRFTLTADTRVNRIVVVSTAGAADEALKLIETLDAPSGAETRTYVFRYVKPQRIDKLVRDMSGIVQVKAYSSTIDAEGNRLIATCPAVMHERIESLRKELDVPSGAVRETYRLSYVRPRRIDKLARDLTESEKEKSLYKSVIDEDAGLLIITALPATHELVKSLIKDMDRIEADPEQSFVRFYKLANTTASQVMATIQSMDVGAGGLATLTLPAREAWFNDPLRDNRFSGANRPPGAAGAGVELPKPPPYTPSEPKAKAGEPVGTATTRPAGAAFKGFAGAEGREPKVIADANTNTIIVIGPPGIQKIYKQLISMLDKRRPQVMVEVILVTLDTSNNFSLGIELARKQQVGDASVLLFSSFGLGTVDQATGIIGLPTPGVGFNGVIVNPDTLNVVLRALAGSGRAKVLAAPRVLVNDNATATLSSVSEAPFTSVNASDTVSTTSFAGYASAGTTLAVTPHISEGDHVQLQYSITLNSFTGEGSGGIPPPRQTNTINSEVTVPDSYAVIVGGLNRKDVSETISKIPWLGDVPILKHLLRLETRNNSESTLFVFLRPVILRDDHFEDLKYLSARELRKAELPPNLPTSEPLVMETPTVGIGSEVLRPSWDASTTDSPMH